MRAPRINTSIARAVFPAAIMRLHFGNGSVWQSYHLAVTRWGMLCGLQSVRIVRRQFTAATAYSTHSGRFGITQRTASTQSRQDAGSTMTGAGKMPAVQYAP